MRRLTKHAILLPSAFLACLWGTLVAQVAATAQEPNFVSQSASQAAASVVKPQTYVSLEPVPRGRNFEIAVVLQIATGYHMNANKISDEFLIPTTLAAQLPKGLRQVRITYPPGHLRKFGFSDKPLNVYDVSAVLRLELAAENNAPLGAAQVPLTLRYQACNDSTCLPPVKIALSAALKIAPAGSKARPVHGELFAAGGAK